MKVIRVSEVRPEKDTGALFIGDVTRQRLVADSKDYTLAMINFEIGARNKWHAHSGDQILFITYGVGYVEDEKQKHEVHAGDVVHVVAGEKHWHGATERSAMSHISLTKAGSVTTTLE
jgi:quercetin dioxygenase-like cupin family protein